MMQGLGYEQPVQPLRVAEQPPVDPAQQDKLDAERNPLLHELNDHSPDKVLPLGHAALGQRVRTGDSVEMGFHDKTSGRNMITTHEVVGFNRGLPVTERVSAQPVDVVHGTGASAPEAAPAIPAVAVPVERQPQPAADAKKADVTQPLKIEAGTDTSVPPADARLGDISEMAYHELGKNVIVTRQVVNGFDGKLAYAERHVRDVGRPAPTHIKREDAFPKPPVPLAPPQTPPPSAGPRPENNPTDAAQPVNIEARPSQAHPPADAKIGDVDEIASVQHGKNVIITRQVMAKPDGTLVYVNRAIRLPGEPSPTYIKREDAFQGANHQNAPFTLEPNGPERTVPANAQEGDMDNVIRWNRLAGEYTVFTRIIERNADDRLVYKIADFRPATEDEVAFLESVMPQQAPNDQGRQYIHHAPPVEDPRASMTTEERIRESERRAAQAGQLDTSLRDQQRPSQLSAQPARPQPRMVVQPRRVAPQPEPRKEYPTPQPVDQSRRRIQPEPAEQPVDDIEVGGVPLSQLVGDQRPDEWIPGGRLIQGGRRPPYRG